MCRRYRQSEQLSPLRKRRLQRFALRFVVGPAMLGLFSLAAVMGVTANVIRFKYPGVDPDAWPQDAVIAAAGMAVMCAVMLAGHALCFRRFLAYRTAKHGRRVALGDVLRSGDAKPRLWRKLTLRAYGVTPSERALAGEIARAGGG